MALGINTEVSSGEGFMGYVKYDARAGRIFTPIRSQDSGGNWTTEDEEVTNKFQAVFDLENMEVGWILFNPGAAPSYEMVKLGEAFPAKPSDKHKQGFRFLMKLGKDCGNEVRTFSHTAKVVLGPIDELHTLYEKEKASHAGQLPVVKLVKTVAIKSGSGDKSSTNYSPVFEIVKWVDRSAMDGAAVKEEAPEPKPVEKKLPDGDSGSEEF